MTPSTPSLRALSVRQPWASAIITGAKDIENRSWPPPAAAIGHWVAIHASALKPSRSVLEKFRSIVGPRHPLAKTDEWPRAQIIGLALIGEPVTRSRSPWFNEGSIGWTIERTFTLPRPVPIMGTLGLWRVPPATARKVLAQVPLRIRAKLMA